MAGDAPVRHGPALLLLRATLPTIDADRGRVTEQPKQGASCRESGGTSTATVGRRSCHTLTQNPLDRTRGIHASPGFTGEQLPWPSGLCLLAVGVHLRTCAPFTMSSKDSPVSVSPPMRRKSVLDTGASRLLLGVGLVSSSSCAFLCETTWWVLRGVWWRSFSVSCVTPPCALPCAQPPA